MSIIDDFAGIAAAWNKIQEQEQPHVLFYERRYRAYVLWTSKSFDYFKSDSWSTNSIGILGKEKFDGWFMNDDDFPKRKDGRETSNFYTKKYFNLDRIDCDKLSVFN